LRINRIYSGGFGPLALVFGEEIRNEVHGANLDFLN
jgi:hypothetical protein